MKTDETKTNELERIEGEVIEGEVVDKDEIESDSDKLYELKLISPTEDGFVKQILWNKEELKAAITELMKRYKNAPYDHLTIAKTDRANLNKLIKAIDDKRKEVKKKFLEPYNAFEADVKEILELIEEPKNQIDNIIKKAEQQQKEQKRRELKAQFDETMRKPQNSNIYDYVTFDRVFEERYLNATFTISKAWYEMREKIENVKRGVDTIEQGNSPHKDAMKSIFLRTFDMTVALEEEARLAKLAAERKEAEKREKEMRLQEEEAKRKAQEEAEKKAAEDNKEISGNDERGDNTAQNQQPAQGAGDNGKAEGQAEQKDIRGEGADSKAATHTGAIVQATFRVFGTVEQLQALAIHMKTCGLKFEAVKK